MRQREWLDFLDPDGRIFEEPAKARREVSLAEGPGPVDDLSFRLIRGQCVYPRKSRSVNGVPK